jgi:predicted enzyme related to lactoylglutathione lyase
MDTDKFTKPLRRIGRFAIATAVVHASCCLMTSAAETETPAVAVGAQYDSSHVYVAPADFDRFVTSFTATFGGATSTKAVTDVTPVPSETASQIALTPAGIVSVFGYTTPIPYPFGIERTGYLVTDVDGAVAAAQADGADVVVAPWNDPIGRDAIIAWPGGVMMQLYSHTVAPHYAALATVPDNRVYVSSGMADTFVRAFVAFAHGTIVSDNPNAAGTEIGLPNNAFRRIAITSAFGNMVVIVTDGHLPYPYGRETTGYRVNDLPATLAKANAAGVTILVAPYAVAGGEAAMVQFPGGYIAEIHATK